MAGFLVYLYKAERGEERDGERGSEGKEKGREGERKERASTSFLTGTLILSCRFCPHV